MGFHARGLTEGFMDPIAALLEETDDFSEVIRYAAFHHRKQRYRGTKVPYVAHLWAVADLARKLCTRYPGLDPQFAATVAALHDIIEDTPVSYADVYGAFGPKVADGVHAVSKNKGTPPIYQMAECLNLIKAQPFEVWIAKIADRIYNLESIARGSTYRKAEAYVDEARLIRQELSLVGGDAIALLDLRIHQCDLILGT